MLVTIFGLVYVVTVLGLIFWGYTPSAQALKDAHDAKVFKEGFVDLLNKSFAFIELKLATDDKAAEDEDLMLFAEGIGYLDIGDDDDIDSDSGEEEFV